MRPFILHYVQATVQVMCEAAGVASLADTPKLGYGQNWQRSASDVITRPMTDLSAASKEIWERQLYLIYYSSMKNF